MALLSSFYQQKNIFGFAQISTPWFYLTKKKTNRGKGFPTGVESIRWGKRKGAEGGEGEGCYDHDNLMGRHESMHEGSMEDYNGVPKISVKSLKNTY